MQTCVTRFLIVIVLAMALASVVLQRATAQEPKAKQAPERPRLTIVLSGLETPPSEDNDIVLKWNDRSVQPPKPVELKWPGGLSLLLPETVQPPVRVESPKWKFSICDADMESPQQATLRYVAWESAEFAFTLQMPDGTPLDFPKVSESIVQLWHESESAGRSRDMPTLRKVGPDRSKLGVSSGTYTVRTAVRIDKSTYLAHKQGVLAKPGKNEVTITLVGPVSWDLFDVIDETGHCSAFGTTFLNCRKSFTAIARVAKSAKPKASDDAEEVAPEKEWAGYAESRLLSFSFHDGLLYDHLRASKKAYFPSTPTGDWYAVSADQLGIYKAVVDTKTKKVTIKALDNAASLTVTVTQPPEGGTLWTGLSLENGIPLRIEDSLGKLMISFSPSEEDTLNWPQVIHFRSLPPGWYNVGLVGADGKSIATKGPKPDPVKIGPGTSASVTLPMPTKED